jgi:chemotaxis protein CheZ
MLLPARADIAEQITALAKRSNNVDADAVRVMVEDIMQSVEGDFSAANMKLFAEVEAVAEFIMSAKAEIASLRPDEITSEHLPTATDELDAIIGATENATNTILESMEELEVLCGTIDNDIAEKINKSVTQVYEACSFQDITGQRISKVVNALQQVENKVTALIEAFGGEFQAAGGGGPSTAKCADGKAERPDEALCNGPQLPGNDISQDDIDALMGFN